MQSGKNNKNVINVAKISSNLGEILLAERGNRLCIVEFSHNKRFEKALDSISKEYGAVVKKRKTDLLKMAEKQLKLYFTGKLKKFNLPMEYTGTDFQVSVWKQLKKIPFGKTVEYGWVADKTGSPGGARATGGAIGRNKLSIVIPCHRVIGKNGSLTGFGGGIWRKEWLLKHEGAL